MRLAILVLLISIFNPSRAESESFHFSPRLIQAYNHILALRLDPGKAILKEEHAKHPNSPALAFVEDYAAFLTAFINESPKQMEKDADAFDNRLRILEKSDASSPFHLYSQAEVLIHKAALRFKFNDYVKGAGNVRAAYKLLKENIQKFPDFKPHHKSMGMLEVLIGTVPPRYQWVTSMLGMEGRMDEGIKKIKDFMNHPAVEPEIAMLKQEAIFLYGFLQAKVVRQKEEAWKVVDEATQGYRNNLLHCYVRATVGLQCKKNEEVIRTLLRRPRGDDYARFYFLDYLLATAKLQKLDPGADIHFKIFVTYSTGENHIKMAYMKLAWSSLIQGNKDLFETYKALADKKGHENFEEDKLAEKLANEDGTPNITILKGRLLFDGGYFDQALSELNSIDPKTLSQKKEQVELTYRIGRVYHEMGNSVEAIKAYAYTMEAGKSESWYYAANSALKTGEIYEEKGDHVQARKYFELAMTFPNDEYKQGINSQAKAGLSRLKGK